MGKYSSLISEAKVALTDTGMNFVNINESGLKANGYCAELKDAAAQLSQFDKTSIFGKLKDIMIDDDDDKLKADAENNVRTLLIRVKACGMCKCASCINVDKSCGCEGCISGTYVVECDKTTERRKAISGVCYVNGMEITDTEYRRGSSQIICNAVNAHGTNSKYIADISTGETRPA